MVTPKHRSANTEDRIPVNYHRPVCVSCNVEMRVQKNGVVVLDHASYGEYAITEADLWRWPKCKHDVVLGFAMFPYARHHEEHFKGLVAHARIDDLIIDNYEYQ